MKKVLYLLCMLTSACLQAESTPDIEDIVVKVGKTFTISLPENMTTGYQWDLIKTPSSIIHLDEHKSIPGTGSRVGASGTSTWKYSANETGTTILSFEYKQPWNPREDNKTRTYRVSVKPHTFKQ